ncbi:hypothetical protein BsWGS_26614 [Bradybaena similaris]
MDCSDWFSGSEAGPSRRPQASIEDTDETTITSDRPITPMNSQWVSFTPQPSYNWRDELTVDNKWKVEQELAQRMSQNDGPSRIVPIAKWMFTILLASAITVLFIATKVSFISLSLALNSTRPISGPTEENMDIWVAYTGQFLVIYMVIAAPYFLLFLRAAWVGLLATDEPWPRKSAVLCCLAVGLLEPLGLVTLALKVLPNFSPSLGVLILGTTTALSIFIETLLLLRQRGGWAVKLAMLLATFFMLAGFAFTAYIISDQVQGEGHQVEDIVHVVVGVVCLNIAWFPRLLSGTCQVYVPPEAHLDDRGGIIASASVTNTDASSTEATNRQLNVQEVIKLPRQAKPRHNVKKATWKASFIIYGVKTMATFLFSFIFFYIDSDFVSSNFDHASQSVFIESWSFAQERLVVYTWPSFGVNLIGALVCYLIAFIASHTNIQRGCLGIPFILSLSLTVLLTASYDLCSAVIDKDLICQTDSTKWYFILGATVCLTLAQALSFGWNSFRKDKIYLRKEDKLFWIPGYNSAVLDSSLLLNSKHTTRHARKQTGERSKSFKTRVYICTTMYREDEGEMRQLLESLAKINMAQVEGETFFESHVIFDGGVKQRKLSDFSLVLISILEDTLGVQPFAATKVVTPYGMKLSWGLPTSKGKPQMTFNIHLKDNTLVKNKKRWSQIMYMSYVLDYLRNTYTLEEETYILTTDADVMFTPGSVEALLDLMTRDSTIGAVCARTHPMGSGPLVWYQIFEYAIGHWFQKATEHVLGSVMCAPGCFSVYRCRALRDILPKYCKKVESSLDFLTKDMGEDRWLCTLMVQSGWRIEYCAASENSTNCPSEFEEFFKQRRRWIASTLANLMLIIREWQYIALFNHQVSVVFLVYQVLLLFSTLISPGTVILIVSGGLYYGWDVSPVTTVILQVILCVLFAMGCILTASETHLLMAKICTFLYAVVMCAVSVGIAVQIVMDLSEDSEKDAGNKTSTSTHKKPSQHISESIPVSITTVYPAFLVSIFVLAGLLHTREITCLFHGICFFLCTPAAYLLLIIYSICNLTDSSWGTREVETSHSTGVQISWSESYKKVFYTIFFCFTSKSARHVDAETQTVGRSISRLSSVAATTDTVQILLAGDERQAVGDDLSIIDEQTQADFLDHQFELEIDVPIPVDKWLHPDFRGQYTEIFRKHGYDSTLFLKGLREADLRRMGITKKGHVQFLIAEIAKLPAFEIEYQVPTNVQDWLQEIGLAEYCDNFYRNHIQTPKEMEILKRFDRKEIEKELGINKDGHVKRLLEAIQKLRDPSESQLKTIKMRQTIEDIPVRYLNEIDVAEYEFWNQLRKKCLEPDLKAFGIDAEVKVNLVELRNSWLLILAVANTLWLILLTTLASKVDLNFLGSNPLGVVFLIVFGLVFLVQFLAMLVHRMATFCHFIARAPYTFNRPFLTTWSFKDKVDNEFEDPADAIAHHQKRKLVDAALKKAARFKRKATSSNSRTDEKSPLLCTDESNHVEEGR